MDAGYTVRFTPFVPEFVELEVGSVVSVELFVVLEVESWLLADE